jgi:dTDP-4-dehydrorhamnose reductase
MKKVIIFGVKGTLGTQLKKEFSEIGEYAVMGLDKDELDITDSEKVSELITKESPQIVINAAAYNAVDKAEKSETEFELAKKLNGEVPKILAEAAKKADAIFVQYVTDYLFDGEKGEYVESDQPNPISNYGISKALGEKNVRDVGGKIYLIRISKLFGDPGKSSQAKKSFFEVMLALAKEKDELKVVDDERSCFTYVPDLAKATRQLVEGDYEFGIYHIVNEGPVTWYGGAKKLFELIGNKKIKVVPVGQDKFPRPAKRASSTVLVNTKFPKLRHYEEALKEWLELNQSF